MSETTEACRHPHVEPVTTRDPLDGGVGPTTLIAQVCVDCHASLPKGWGCPDCEFTELQVWGTPAPFGYDVRPCEVHA